MDPNSIKTMAAAAGAAGDDPLYTEDVFDTRLYYGTSSARTFTNGIDLAGEGGLVWCKSRGNTRAHRLCDTERGATYNLYTNSQEAQSQESDCLTAFNDDGFTLGNSSQVNHDGEKYVAWTFRKAPGFFDVVQFTKSSESAQSFAHNLGCVPGMMIIKRVGGANHWSVWHKSLPDTDEDFLHLNEANSYESSSTRFGADPTATHFTVGSHNEFSGSNTYIAYLFADGDNAAAQVFGAGGNESIVKCGTFNGGGYYGGGNLVNLGWEPQWVITKQINGSANWEIADIWRGAGSLSGQADGYRMYTNAMDADATYNRFSPVGNGFRHHVSGSSSDTFIYIAIRRPFKPPEAGTDVFHPSQVARNTAYDIPGGWSADAVISKRGTGTDGALWGCRIHSGMEYYTTDNNVYDGGINYWWFNHETGRWKDTHSNDPTVSLFKRAPGVFDTGYFKRDGSTTAWTVSHSLGVVPELMIVRNARYTSNWMIYHKDYGNTKGAAWNDNWAGYVDQGNLMWNSTTPTSSVFYVANHFDTNYNFGYWLFASKAGISKVGKYDGTGNDINVDCGFTNGARFVLIWRGDAHGESYLFDTGQGINSGNDTYYLPESTAAEVTSNDYIDPYSAGFTITSSAPDDLNANGGEYTYLAIA